MATNTVSDCFDESVLSGIDRACNAAGLDTCQILVKKAAQDIMDNSVEMQKLYSKAGARLLEMGGFEGSVPHRILCKCASYDTLLSPESYDQYIRPVEEVMQKQAKGAALEIIPKALGLLADAPYLAAALAAGGGALAGGGFYALQRAMEQGDAEVEAKYQQAKAYREAARQLVEKINNGKSNTTAVSTGLFA